MPLIGTEKLKSLSLNYCTNFTQKISDIIRGFENLEYLNFLQLNNEVPDIFSGENDNFKNLKTL